MTKPKERRNLTIITNIEKNFADIWKFLGSSKKKSTFNTVKMRILIVEDEINLRQDAGRYLCKNGYECEFSDTLRIGKQKLRDWEFHAALIDIGLPDGSGIELVKYIKAHFPAMGIIIISARNSLDDKIDALKIGADDYLTKPYHLSELSARLYSVIRRRNFGGKNMLIFDGLEINLSDKKAISNGNELKLTKKEYEVLVYLASNPTYLVTKQAIADNIWGEKADMAETFDFVYTQLKNLKKKLVDAGLKNYIKVFYGMGYRFMD